MFACVWKVTTPFSDKISSNGTFPPALHHRNNNKFKPHNNSNIETTMYLWRWCRIQFARSWRHYDSCKSKRQISQDIHLTTLLPYLVSKIFWKFWPFTGMWSLMKTEWYNRYLNILTYWPSNDSLFIPPPLIFSPYFGTHRNVIIDPFEWYSKIWA